MIARRDAAGIGDAAEHELLAHYGLTRADLVGQGTEAKVYALDGDRVLKVYAGQDQRAALETLADFYGRLDAGALPYLLPRIHEIHPHGDLLAVVERRIDGVPMEEFVSADDPDLEELYLRTVVALAQVRITPPLGRFMLLEPAGGTTDQAEDWHGLLTSLIIRKLPAVLPILRQDVPEIDARVGSLLVEFAQSYVGPVRVIHGDLYPGNILMGCQVPFRSSPQVPAWSACAGPPDGGSSAGAYDASVPGGSKIPDVPVRPPT
jgi:hypothetical protein